MKSKLMGVKQELEKINTEIKQKQQLYEELSNLPEVKKYKETAEDLILTSGKRNKLDAQYLELLQDECIHPLWYLLNSGTDSYESKTYWTCKCVACGKIEEERAKNFENVITGNGLFALYNKSQYSYNEIKKTYNELVSVIDTEGPTNINENDIAKLLVKKYNVK